MEQHQQQAIRWCASASNLRPRGTGSSAISAVIEEAHRFEFAGLLVQRPFDGRWEAFQGDIDDARSRFGESLGVTASSACPSCSVDRLLEAAALPAPLSQQIHDDACALACAWTEMLPEAKKLTVRLEIFGENMCSRWHRDHFVGRAIVSYTGAFGTAYTRQSNVDLWQLNHGGDNEHILRDPEQIEHVAVGDLLLIKGTKFPQVSNPLVHKSPEKRYDADGHVLNRLVLKVDVDGLAQ